MSIKNVLPQLPSTPGIYLFYNNQKELIYVGKATSLKNRVRSYFNSHQLQTPFSRSLRLAAAPPTKGGTKRPIEEMIDEVVHIKWEETDTALEAIILESIYIKKYQPKYNVLGKDNKSWNYIVITKDPYPEVTTLRQHELALMTEEQKKREFRYMFGPYPGFNRNAAMKLLRRIFRFSTCRPGSKRPCLYRQMGQCLGVCTGEISSRDYRRQVITPLATFLRGGKKVLVKKWETEMKRAAKAENFERAAGLRDQLSSLYRMHDIALLNESFVRDAFDTVDDSTIIRIEGYDISNLGKTGKVGSMVVFIHGEPEKHQYRKFEIKTVAGQSDVDSLRELLERRFKRMLKEDRTFAEFDPDLLVIDGGTPQLNTAVSVAAELGIQIPIVSIAKGSERKRNDFFFAPDIPKEVIDWVDRHKDVLIRVRDEAHRFAITYQRKKRSIL